MSHSPHEADAEAPLLGEMGSSSGQARPAESNAFRLYIRNNWTDPWSLVAQGGIIVFLLAVWTIVIPNPAGLFSYHPPFQTAAILLFTQGVLALQPTRTPTAKRTGLAVHEVFQILGAVSLIIGTSFILYNKDVHSAPHFTSWHGILGFATFIVVLIQSIFGALVGFESLRRVLGGDAKAKSLWRYHRAAGYGVFVLFVLTALTATQADWVKMNASEKQVNVWIVGLLIGGLGIAGRISVKKILP